MCGIAGYWGSQPPSDSAIERTLELMKRRGPDSQQAWRAHTTDGRSVCLLHSRLSIIDLDPRSNQPFTIGATTLVFNGEIYNYVELRERLAARGVKLNTTSDTEVLLQSYREFGADCVRQFEGMWSFAIFDAERQILLLSRDRFGEKPLYLMRTPHGLYFGSEVKFLAALSGTRLRPDVAHLNRYLSLGYKSLYKVDRTFFEGVEELGHAQSLTVGPDRIGEPTHYWRPQPRPVPSMTLDEAIEGSREKLLQSMRLRVRADVPLAFCLSGGVDSSALVSIAAKSLGCRLETFSIIDEDERYNEEDNILATVRDVGCAHQLIRIPRQNAIDRLQDLVAYHDSPLATITFYVHSMISEAVHRGGYRVAFSGTSADELFTGYYDHFLLHLHAVRDEPDYADYLRDWQSHIASFVRNPILRDPDLYSRDPGFRAHVFDGSEELSGYLVSPTPDEFTESRYTPDLLRNRMLNELFHEATPVILHEDDLNSMRYSVENRSPFLDTALFDFAYSIPARHLIRNGFAKYVLREAVAGILNDTVRLDRRKKGFNASINSMVDFRDPAVRDYLLDPTAEVFRLVRRERIAQLFELYPVPNHLSKFLFSFINARIFMEQFPA
jgi:asparagine synthase (glutamine-hydrolysing)